MKAPIVCEYDTEDIPLVHKGQFILVPIARACATSRKLQNKKILILPEKTSMRVNINAMLHCASHSHFPKHSGQEAMNAMNRHTLALILTRTVVFAGKIKIILIRNFLKEALARVRNVLLARAGAHEQTKYELVLTFQK